MKTNLTYNTVFEMKEDINIRIIKKLQEKKHKNNVSSFLVDAIREEFERRELKRWKFKEAYDRLIGQYADKEDLQK